MSPGNWLVLVCAVAFAFIGFVAVSEAYVLHRAKELTADIQGLDKGLDPTVAAGLFTKKYRRYLAETTCDRDACQFRFVFDNRVLSIPRLAKQAEIEVIVSFFHERLDAVMASLTSNVFQENSPVVHVAESFCKDRTDISCKEFAINPHGRNVEPAWNGNIFIDQLASQNQKQAGWAFNFDCLMSYKGCHDISEINPLIWKRTSPNRVSTRVRSTADSMAEAAQPLSD
jgi:hypothetical protein